MTTRLRRVTLCLSLVTGLLYAMPVAAQERTMRLTSRTPVHALAREDSDVRATLEPGVVVTLGTEVGTWTAITGPDNLRGWVLTASLGATSATTPVAPTKPIPVDPSPPPTRPPGSEVPPPRETPRSFPGDQAPGDAQPGPAGFGLYHTRRSAGLSYQAVDDVDALSFNQARMAGSWAEIGYTLTGERIPALDGEEYFLTLSGNFRFFPMQPDGTNPVGIVLEAVASMGRWLNDEIEGQLAGVGGHGGLFGRVPFGTGAIMIPRAGYQLTRYLPLPDEDNAFTASQWYVGLEAQLGGLVPNLFVGSAEGRSILVLGLTIAY